ncbi:5-oxoprolinase subunit PxpB [Cytobacillus sp.]|uniref:5-oxoprolinase subunit PxpB n=1 Tax=Cytobacillus sp. TaxID=2675269 RepID=UPI0028BD973B|nr:5-oxoprolinase subunit PxpB [Cytobacillus sp.]
MSKLYEQLPEAMITGENSLRFSFGSEVEKGTYYKVRRFSKIAEQHSGDLFQEIVPSFHTVTIYFKKELKEPNEIIERLLNKWIHCKEEEAEPMERKLQIPVCYDDVFSLDMDRVTNHTKLTREEVISLHAGHTYTVYMIGFLPGFPYLGRLHKKLATPRLATPRDRVAKGTVGIGGSQTGIYSLDCPGGWNIIGKTPLDLYMPERKEPFFFQAGDQLVFQPVSLVEFYEISNELASYPEEIKRFIVG